MSTSVAPSARKRASGGPPAVAHTVMRLLPSTVRIRRPSRLNSAYRRSCPRPGSVARRLRGDTVQSHASSALRPGVSAYRPSMLSRITPGMPGSGRRAIRLPLAASQIRAPVSLAVAISRPPAPYVANEASSEPASSTCSGRPLELSQVRAVPSCDAVSSCRPSGLNWTVLTGFACSTRAMRSRVPVSQTATRPSAPALAARRPSSANSTSFSGAASPLSPRRRIDSQPATATARRRAKTASGSSDRMSTARSARRRLSSGSRESAAIACAALARASAVRWRSSALRCAMTARTASVAVATSATTTPLSSRRWRLALARRPAVM